MVTESPVSPVASTSGRVRRKKARLVEDKEGIAVAACHVWQPPRKPMAFLERFQMELQKNMVSMGLVGIRPPSLGEERLEQKQNQHRQRRKDSPAFERRSGFGYARLITRWWLQSHDLIGGLQCSDADRLGARNVCNASWHHALQDIQVRRPGTSRFLRGTKKPPGTGGLFFLSVNSVTVRWRSRVPRGTSWR